MVAEYAEQSARRSTPRGFQPGGTGRSAATWLWMSAARLEQRGRQVAFVGWIDAPAPVRAQAFWTRSGRRRRQSRTYPWARCGWNCSVSCFRSGPADRTACHPLLLATTDDEQRWTRMSDWAEAEIGAEFATLRSEIAQSNELEVSWELKTDPRRAPESDGLPASDGEGQPLWAARSTNAIQRSAVERSMARRSGCVCRTVRVLDTRHDKDDSPP